MGRRKNARFATFTGLFNYVIIFTLQLKSKSQVG
nr:MAG TPA: hypothetical protein [Bacteriophage sp.]